MSVISASFRSRVRAGVEPIARLFGRAGLTPNMLTLIGFGIAVVGAWLAATQAWLAAGLVVAFGAIFDLFDGALARATNRTSSFGAFLDSTMDRAGEAVVYLGIVVAALVDEQGRVLAPLGAAAMAASFLVSYTRAKSESLGFSSGTGMAAIGLAPREVRTAILVVGLLAAGLLPQPHPIQCFVAPCPQPVGPAWALMAALGLIAILAGVTTIQRILFTYNQSRSRQQEVSH
jgi:phosphatidylglycerophosphate synthase